ncbi:hypothetical protein [Brevibacillus sp. SYSU BS000544]|uniref:hypothetical protein n=1 Tax=Brevibacillus sp. SYSU BS000544 TaxID=3416443 RepID=UPI003CE53FE7
MILLKHVMIRFGSSIIAFMVYTILLSLFFSSGLAEFFRAFVFYFVFGFFVGYKGVVILPFLSLFLDIPIDNILSRTKFPGFIILFVKTILYFICGALIAFFVYGNESFLIASGAIVSTLFLIIFTVLWKLNKD